LHPIFRGIGIDPILTHINYMNERIIVIEDDDIVRQNLESILEVSGFKVSCAANGGEGLKLLAEKNPDLILCDINLPDMLGYDILDSVRGNDSTAGIPFIFLTALSEMKDLRKGMNLGADDYLVKPFVIAELLGVIKRRLELSGLRRGNQKEDDKKIDSDAPIFINTSDGIKSFRLEMIECVFADGEYSYIHTTEKKKILVRKLLKEWEEILPDKKFLRIHKSIIVSISHITKIEKWFNNSIRITLQNYQEPLIASRRYSSKIKELYFI
jgi:DNA-binding LytR/AlgR family response regulator